MLFKIRRPKEFARDVIVTAVLLVLLVIVLLPMLWMVLTAFKVKGTAFQLSFLPETSLFLPEVDQPPFRLPVLDENGWYLHAEKDAPGATTVKFLVIPNGGEEITFPMQRFSGGTWAVTAGPLPKGVIHYSFLVNDERDFKNVNELETREYVKDNQLTVISGENTNTLIYEQDDEIHVRLQGSVESEYGLELGPDNYLWLQPDGPAQAGRRAFTATAPAPQFSNADQFWWRLPEPEEDQAAPAIFPAFRVVEKRSLGTAIADKYTLENFRVILTSETFNFLVYFMNSLIVAGSAGLLTVFICTMAGYAFTTKPFHFREQLFALLLMSMLVPGMIYMVPQFSITLRLGLMNSYSGMVIPHLANVFGLFLLRQYIGQIPRDLFAAAQIDGARERQVFTNIVIPMCLPIMVTLFLLVFVTQWSNFLWQLIVNTGTSTVLTLPVGLQQFKGQNANEWEKIMAGACFSILPIAALFLTLQKYFLEGLTAGAVKE